MAMNRFHVAEHAVLRYMERVVDIDKSQARASIEAIADRAEHVGFTVNGASLYVVSNVCLVVRDDTVVTVLSEEDRQRAEALKAQPGTRAHGHWIDLCNRLRAEERASMADSPLLPEAERKARAARREAAEMAKKAAIARRRTRAHVEELAARYAPIIAQKAAAQAEEGEAP